MNVVVVFPRWMNLPDRDITALVLGTNRLPMAGDKIRLPTPEGDDTEPYLYLVDYRRWEFGSDTVFVHLVDAN